ncbi:MAG: hypothetical protein GX589_01990 [Deltaproteobacteria bacterium]|nr:hypothetical protein [Deltaproteobacteria bacterium]
MTFLYLILAAFFAGTGLGYLKFFMLGVLCDQVYSPADKQWVIQAVGAIITVGPCLIYAASGPLAAAHRKFRVMFFSGATTAALLLFGALTGWAGTPWLYVFSTGLIMGIFNPAKNAAIPLEAAYGKRSTELVNAALNISYLGGLLGGIPSGVWLYENHPNIGALTAILLFALAGLCGGLCRFQDESAHLQPFFPSVYNLLRDSSYLLRTYLVYILVSALIWGLASAVSLAITAYAEEQNLGDAVACSLMSVYAVIGVVIGCAFSPKLTPWRYRTIIISTSCMALVMVAIPLTSQVLGPAGFDLKPDLIYRCVGTLTLILGVMFGVSTNLIEGEYFSLIYREKKEGTGAALLSAGTAFFAFLFGGMIGLSIHGGWVSATTQFYWLAALTAVAALLTFKLPPNKNTNVT